MAWEHQQRELQVQQQPASQKQELPGPEWLPLQALRAEPAQWSQVRPESLLHQWVGLQWLVPLALSPLEPVFLR